ncbi:MAG: PEGA domain-containing protein [Myxococcota bacterium]
MTPAMPQSAAFRRPLTQLGFLLGLALATVMGLAAAPVLAQPVDANQAKANGLYKDAKERFESNDFQNAYELSLEAERLFAHPSITFLKGRALRKLGRLREAEEALKAADSPQLPKALQKPLADERLALAEELRLKGELRVKVQPSNAIVSVDGETAKGDFDRWVLVGKHRIEIAAPDYRPVVRVVEVTAGETTETKIALSPLGGTLTVVAPGGLKGVDVLVDGVVVDISEGARAGDRAPPLSVTVGSHEVVCVRGDKRVTRNVQVEIDAAVEVECAGLVAHAARSSSKALGWGGVAVGGVVAGYGLYGLASYLFVDMADKRGVQDSNKPTLGTVFTVAGLATGVVSYLLFVHEPAPPPAAATAAQ